MTKVDLSKPLVYTNGESAFPVKNLRERHELLFDVFFDGGVKTRVVDANTLKNYMGWRLENAKEKKTFYRFDYKYEGGGDVHAFTFRKKKDAISMKNYFERRGGVIILSDIYEVTFEI